MGKKITQKEENHNLLTELSTAVGARKTWLENQIVSRNMPFVKNQARKFMYRSQALGLELEDLHQAGAIGLIIAARRYNGKASYSTYAGWYVLREMQRLAEKSHPIHRPRSASLPYKTSRLIEVIRALTNETATDEQLGAKVGTVDNWRQTPAFFPLMDADEKPYDIPTAEESLIEDETLRELGDILQCLDQEEKTNLLLVIDGKRGDEGAAYRTLETLRICLLT